MRPIRPKASPRRTPQPPPGASLRARCHRKVPHLGCACSRTSSTGGAVACRLLVEPSSSAPSDCCRNAFGAPASVANERAHTQRQRLARPSGDKSRSLAKRLSDPAHLACREQIAQIPSGEGPAHPRHRLGRAFGDDLAAGFSYRHSAYGCYRRAPGMELEGLPVVPPPATDLAGDIHVGQELHLDLDDPVARAGFAAAALDSEGEAPRGVATEA